MAGRLPATPWLPLIDELAPVRDRHRDVLDRSERAQAKLHLNTVRRIEAGHDSLGAAHRDGASREVDADVAVLLLPGAVTAGPRVS